MKLSTLLSTLLIVVWLSGCGSGGSSSDGPPPPPPPSTPITQVGIQGDRFTIDGTPTFLLGVSYFDTINWRTSDLDGLSSRGYNLIRIWLDWRESTFDASGNFVYKQDALDLVRAAAERGIVVDVTILHTESDGASAVEAVTQAVAALKDEPNVFFDLVNEHNCGTWSESHSAMASLVADARSVAPNAIITFSSACEPHVLTSAIEADGGNIDGELAAGIDVITPHFDRTDDWYDRVDQSVVALKSYLFSVKSPIPVYVQEEHRNGFWGSYFTKDQLVQAAVEAYDSGAAAYIFHTDAGFDLFSASFFDSLDGEERGAIDEIPVVGQF